MASHAKILASKAYHEGFMTGVAQINRLIRDNFQSMPRLEEVLFEGWWTEGNLDGYERLPLAEPAGPTVYRYAFHTVAETNARQREISRLLLALHAARRHFSGAADTLDALDQSIADIRAVASAQQEPAQADEDEDLNATRRRLQLEWEDASQQHQEALAADPPEVNGTYYDDYSSSGD